MLPYFFNQRDVHSTTVKQSIKPRVGLGTETRDALWPAVQPPLTSVAVKYVEHECF